MPHKNCKKKKRLFFALSAPEKETVEVLRVKLCIRWEDVPDSISLNPIPARLMSEL